MNLISFLCFNFVYSKDEIQAKNLIDGSNSNFGKEIEGAVTNKQGWLLATNYENKLNQIGLIKFQYNNNQFKVKEQKVIFIGPLPNSYFNGIRFFNSSMAFVTDKTNHQIYKLNFDTETNLLSYDSYCNDKNMLEPNDLTISNNGYLYLSGMNYQPNTQLGNGDFWMCTPEKNNYKSEAIKIDTLDRTNGIEINLKNDLIYLSESSNKDNEPNMQKIWTYEISNNKPILKSKKLFLDFSKLGEFKNEINYDIDGTRTDIYGNLYVTRHGNSRVYKFNKEGELLAIIKLNSIKRPTNLEFGSENGNVLFIVGQCIDPKYENKGCVDYVEFDKQNVGKSWENLQKNLRFD